MSNNYKDIGYKAISGASDGDGIVVIGNYTNSSIDFTIVGTKNGEAAILNLSVSERSHKISTGWDCGNSQSITIISSYRDEKYIVKPFKGVATFVWHKKVSAR
jgi:hypothetical protein